MDDFNYKREKRVFLNNIDTYSSKFIAQYLSECVGGSLDGEDEEPNTTDTRFQIVGTTANDESKTLRFAVEQYRSLSRAELLQQLLQCDVIVYNISEEQADIEEATWAISALHCELEQFETPKIFILLSTIMTWALTKPADPEEPEISLTEEDYRRRRPHPDYKEHTSVEKLVLKLGKTKKAKLVTYVVSSGLQYGMGENMFHFFFKTAWLGHQCSVPIIGPGTNVIPVIHIHDLARVVQKIIDLKPKTHYFIAADDSKSSAEDIVKAISSALGSGETEIIPMEKAAKTNIEKETDLVKISVSLRIESVFLKEKLNVTLDFESGIIDNIVRVLEEYRQTRLLLPIKICLIGPPAVGKTSAAKELCRYYKIHHVTIDDAVAEKVRLLEDLLEKEKLAENEEMVVVAEEQLAAVKDSMLQNGLLDEQFAMKIILEKLKSKPCTNQGFVLDGYVTTYAQAHELFHDPEKNGVNEMTSPEPHYNKLLTPEFIFSLEATDNFLKERVCRLPQHLVEEKHYNQEEFTDSLDKFRQTLVEDKSVLDYFDELEVHPEHIDCEKGGVVEKIIGTVGQPMNYGLSPEEMEVERKRKEDKQCQEFKLDEEEMDTVKKEKLTTILPQWNKHVAVVKSQEEELLDTYSVPMRHYLVKHIMPAVMRGLLDCCKVMPDDPVEFLAEHLLRNNIDD